MKLMDIIVPQIPTVFRRILDLSIYFEKKYCDQTTMTTFILQKTYNELFSKHADIKYNLFDNFNINLDFFNEFNKTFYGRVILLIFIAFIISKLITLFK